MLEMKNRNGVIVKQYYLYNVSFSFGFMVFFSLIGNFKTSRSVLKKIGPSSKYNGFFYVFAPLVYV
jgi:hypothetical protein